MRPSWNRVKTNGSPPRYERDSVLARRKTRAATGCRASAGRQRAPAGAAAHRHPAAQVQAVARVFWRRPAHRGHLLPQPLDAPRPPRCPGALPLIR